MFRSGDFLLISACPVVLSKPPVKSVRISGRAMSKAIQQQDVSVLSAAKHGLVYLTANDWALIADKAVRTKFKPGDQIIEQGKRTHGIYLLLKGTATVHIPTQEIPPAIGPGEVCGEISFLDEQPATVSVVAKESVETFYLDRPTLQSLFELFPHLGSRFYRSLASSLSYRLREVIKERPGSELRKKN
jgi:CRP/FNR family transcriptional regulator, cyclic AMP receptor protein